MKNGQTYSLHQNLFLLKTNYCFFSTKPNINLDTFESSGKIALKKNEYLTFLVIERQFSSSFSLYSKFFKSTLILQKPLLETTRFTVSKLRKFYDFPIINDMTNFCSTIARNKIRYNLFPFIRHLFLPNFEFLLNNFLKILKNEQNTLKKDIEEKIFLLKNKNLRLKKYLNTTQNLKIKNTIHLGEGNGYLVQKVFLNSYDIELSYIQTSLIKKILTSN